MIAEGEFNTQNGIKGENGMGEAADIPIETHFSVVFSD